MADLHAMLGDIDVPDARIGAFLTVRPDLSSPFGPVAVPDPLKVSIGGPLDAFHAQAALSRVVRPYDPRRGTAWHIATPELIDTLALIERAYVTVLEDVERHLPERQFPDLRVVIHGYDHAPTRSLPAGDPDRPLWARDWTGTPLGGLGFPDNAAASRVVAAVVDRVNALTARVCAAYRRAVFADLRGSVPPGEWADELHPTSRGFAAAATRLRRYL